jgi:hypothetical protein
MATTLPEYQSQLPALLKSFGEKTTTSASGNTAPLDEVFRNAMTASGMNVQDMSTMIESIFREGSTKVPELANLYANSTGGRVSGNSALNLASGDLNRQLTTQAMTALLNHGNTNRQIAGTAANGIAQATRGTTSSTKPKVNPLVTILGGTLLNKLGKNDTAKNLLNKVFNNEDSPTDISLAGTPTDHLGDPYSSGMYDNTGGGDGVEIDFGGGDLGSNMVFDGLDYGPDPTSVDFGDGGGFDADFDQYAPIDATNLDFDTGSFLEEFGDWDLGFKNGGSLNAVNRKPRGYADGGVINNRNKVINGAPTSRPAPLVQAMQQQVVRPPATGTPTRRPRGELLENSTVYGESGGNGMTNADNTNGVVGDADSNAAAVAGAIGLAASLGLGIPSAVTSAAMTAMGIPNSSMNPVSNLMSALISAMTSPEGFPAPEGFDQATVDSIANDNDAAVAGISAGSAGGTTGGANADGGTGDTGSDGVAGGTGVGTSGTDGSAGSDGGNSAGTSAGGGTTGGDTTGGGAGTYRDGGLIRGPGTSISDSIRAVSREPGGPDVSYSNNEYVMPEDVVRFWGTKKLDEMKNALHKPAAARR